MFDFPTGYYWAHRKGSPEPQIVYIFNNEAYDIVYVVEKELGYMGRTVELTHLELDREPLSEQKWIVDKPVEYEK